MPFNVAPETLKGLVDTRLLTPEPKTTADVALFGQVQAAFGRENVLGSFLVDQQLSEDFDPEADFDPAEYLQPGEELYAREFADARSRKEMDYLRRRHDFELELQRRMAEGPLPEWMATTLAVLADPTSYVPLVGVAARGRTATRVALGAMGAATEVGLSEAALHATQQTRTIEESVAAVIMGGAFGAGLVGAGAVLSAAGREAHRAAVDDLVTIMRAEAPESTAGAAARQTLDPDDTLMAAAFGLEKLLPKLNKIGLAAPSVEMLTSPFAAIRRAALQLTDVGVVTKGVLKGNAMPTVRRGPEPAR